MSSLQRLNSWLPKFPSTVELESNGRLPQPPPVCCDTARVAAGDSATLWRHHQVEIAAGDGTTHQQCHQVEIAAGDGETLQRRHQVEIEEPIST